MRLGVTVRDRITGFRGVVTAHAEYLTGCNQALVQPTELDAGKYPSACWLDVQRLVIEEAELFTLDNGKTPGCDAPAPPIGHSLAP